jgi:hypothetical protein
MTLKPHQASCAAMVEQIQIHNAVKKEVLLINLISSHRTAQGLQTVRAIFHPRLMVVVFQHLPSMLLKRLVFHCPLFLEMSIIQQQVVLTQLFLMAWIGLAIYMTDAGEPAAKDRGSVAIEIVATQSF